MKVAFLQATEIIGKCDFSYKGDVILHFTQWWKLNDICENKVWKELQHKPADSLSFRELYSEFQLIV